jgi:ABC-type glutathione transport system ATPase component
LKTYDSGIVSLLEMRGVTVELPTAGGWVKPVDEVSLRIAAGECLGLVGESGSGKTMLSLALTGLLPPRARVNGEICLRGSKKKENSNAEAQSTQRNAEEDRGRESPQGLKPNYLGDAVMSDLKVRPPTERGTERNLVGVSEAE